MDEGYLRHIIEHPEISARDMRIFHTLHPGAGRLIPHTSRALRRKLRAATQEVVPNRWLRIVMKSEKVQA